MKLYDLPPWETPFWSCQWCQLRGIRTRGDILVPKGQEIATKWIYIRSESDKPASAYDLGKIRIDDIGYPQWLFGEKRTKGV